MSPLAEADALFAPAVTVTKRPVVPSVPFVNETAAVETTVPVVNVTVFTPGVVAVTLMTAVAPEDVKYVRDLTGRPAELRIQPPSEIVTTTGTPDAATRADVSGYTLKPTTSSVDTPVAGTRVLVMSLPWFRVKPVVPVE